MYQCGFYLCIEVRHYLIFAESAPTMAVNPSSGVVRAGQAELAHGPGTTEYGRMLDRPGPGRPLVYPYTIMGRVFQFPWKLNWQRNWVFRYYIIGWFATLPLIYQIHKMGRFFFSSLLLWSISENFLLFSQQPRKRCQVEGYSSEMA
jgi:hypothetical protein